MGLNQKVPPDENNFSWARLSLLRRPRPVKQTRATEFPLSFPTHVFRFDLKYSINSLVEQVTRIFILRETCPISKKNVSRLGRDVFKIQDLVHAARTSIRVGQELRSTSPVLPGVLINLLANPTPY